MDSAQDRGRTSRRPPASISLLLFAATLVSPTSWASCYVSDKVVRDGIVGLPFTGSPPPALDLTPLGKVLDSGQQDIYSIWEIANPGTADIRVELTDAAGNYHIPVLARATSRTIVRSDNASAAAPHNLLVNGAVVDSDVSSATTFVDYTELGEAECNFQGNPLYVAEQQGSLKISTIHGATIAEITSATAVETLATEPRSGAVWTLSDNMLHSYDPFGEPLQSMTAPGTGTVPPGVQHLAIEQHENLWLVRGSTLYRIRLASGNAVASVTYDEPIREVTINPRNGMLWVLLSTTARIVRGTDNSQYPILEVESIPLPAAGRTITYDAYWSEMWIATTGGLLRYDLSGALTTTFSSLPILPTDHVVADGSGGVWGANGFTVVHIDSTGTTDAQLNPFAVGTAIVDVAADPADGTVWVASATRIRNYSRQQTLLQDIVPSLFDGVIRQLRTLDLFADRTPPSVRILSPMEGEEVHTPRPVLEVEYADIGGRLAPDTLEFRVGSELLPTDCSPIVDGATCTLDTDLPPGEVTILPSILDLAGNQSGEQPRTFTVISGEPPSVDLGLPDGASTNDAELTLHGSIDQPATLTINGQPVTVSGSLEFTHTVTLLEGPNTLHVVATASNGGAINEFDFLVILDTIPPAVPVVSLIRVELLVPGMLQVVGQAGSVEPYAYVDIRNATTGLEISVQADENGAFSAFMEASIGDQLLITVRDEAGNLREDTELANSAQTLRIQLESPSQNASIDKRLATVSGNLVGPMDTGVAINGIPATVVGTGVMRRFYANVPLQAGQNQLNVVARHANGAEVSRTAAVTRDGDPPFSVTASPTSGIPPLNVTFNIVRHVPDRIMRIRIDFDGDDVVDLVETSRKTVFTHLYAEPGVYRVRFWVQTQAAGQLPHEDVIELFVAVSATSDADTHVQAVWQLFKQSLSGGNLAGALAYMTPDAAQDYEGTFTVLSSQMAAIVGSFSAAEPVRVLGGAAEYVVRRPRAGGGEEAFFVYFSQASDGTWRIAGL